MASVVDSFDNRVPGVHPTEMEIVDTFTRLIFGDREAMSPQELLVVDALRSVEDDVACDDLAAMSVYLRALGVQEMISLVSRVRQYFLSQVQTRSPAAIHQPVQF
jgi:hypothetical protein